MQHEIFDTVMKRVLVDDSIMEFKKQSGLHPDVYKSSYAQFIQSRK